MIKIFLSDFPPWTFYNALNLFFSDNFINIPDALSTCQNLFDLFF